MTAEELKRNSVLEKQRTVQDLCRAVQLVVLKLVSYVIGLASEVVASPKNHAVLETANAWRVGDVGRLRKELDQQRLFFDVVGTSEWAMTAQVAELSINVRSKNGAICRATQVKKSDLCQRVVAAEATYDDQQCRSKAKLAKADKKSSIVSGQTRQKKRHFSTETER